MKGTAEARAQRREPLWAGAFVDLPREHGFEPLRVEGAIPADLEGTVYRNGPSLMESGGRRYDHWFDGDGGIAAIRFEAGRARGAARLVRSAALEDERRSGGGHRLYGGYGTVQPGLVNRLRGRLKNAANTSVLAWNGRLFALWEAGLPTEISPEDLSTLGEVDLGAVVQTFSAHPHRVPARGAIYNIGVRYGRRAVLDLYELGADGHARRLDALALPGRTFIHDFAVTERFVIVFAPPLRLDALRMLAGRGSFAENLAWKPELGTDVLLVPIADPAATVRISVDPFYQWHFANAYEQDDEIVVDFVRYPDFSSNHALADLMWGRGGAVASGELSRAVLDLRRHTVAIEPRWSRPCEFPRIAPSVESARHRYCYVATYAPGTGEGLHDAVAKVDVDAGRADELALPEGQYASEPIFVPRPGGDREDDGYVLVLVADPGAGASHCAVLDARDLEAGPLARAHFDHLVPPRFHGTWVPRR